MALPTINGTVRCAFRGLVPSGRQWTNVWHARYAGGASFPGPTEIAALDAKLVRMYTGSIYSGGSVWLAQCTTGVTLIDATYYVLNGSAGPVGINHTAAGPGAIANSQASEVAHVLSLRTGLRGRRYRGRIYLPGVSTTNVPSGILSSALVTTTLAQLNALQTDLQSIQWELGVASYGESWNRGPHNAHGSATHVTWAPFFTTLGNAPTACSIDTKPDVQRRRK
jgi:hypothetical protein